MVLKNVSQLRVVDSFIVLYKESLREIKGCVRFCTFFMNPFDGEKDNSPLVNLFGNVAISKRYCKKYNFTDQEIHAMIAHEIGHIVHKTIEKEAIQLEKEKMADGMAKVLGLGDKLADALQKIIDSGDFTNIETDLHTRINCLRNCD